MKMCSKCKENLPLEDFSKNGNKLRSQCKKCDSIVKKEHYEYNHKLKVDYINSFKQPCKKCKEDRIYLIDFHHINPSEKDCNISSIIVNSKSFKSCKDTIDAELDKCITLCSNCHREFHYLERTMNITIEEYVGVV